MKRLMFDRQLRYFLICAQELSFTKAAVRLGITQSALSQQMRQFEKQVEQVLFIRKGRGVALTTAGMQLRQKIEPHFIELDQIVGDFKYQEGISEGTISIASVHPILSYLLPDLIANFADKYPKVSFNLRGGGSYRVVDLTKKRSADFGVIYNNVVSDMDIKPLFTERLSAVFSSRLPMANEILKTKKLPDKTPLILAQTGFSLRHLVDTAFKGRTPYIRIETETVDSMLNFALAGAGVCFLPDYIFNRYPELKHCELDGLNMQVPVALVTKPNLPISPVIAQFIEELKVLVK